MIILFYKIFVYQEVDRSSDTSARRQTQKSKKDDTRKSPSDSEEIVDEKDSSDASQEDDPAKKKVSFFTYFKFMFELINSFIISATRYLNRFSRDYRYIRKVLSKEKLILKVS